jgi:hypothetical protein
LANRASSSQCFRMGEERPLEPAVVAGSWERSPPASSPSTIRYRPKRPPRRAAAGGGAARASSRRALDGPASVSPRCSARCVPYSARAALVAVPLAAGRNRDVLRGGGAVCAALNGRGSGLRCGRVGGAHEGAGGGEDLSQGTGRVLRGTPAGNGAHRIHRTYLLT